MKSVLQTCLGQIGQDVIDRTIAQFCKRLSQPMENTLSTALTNVLGATVHRVLK